MKHLPEPPKRKTPQPMHETTALAPQPPLASGGDDKLGVHLTWVIVRDGMGNRARNADWDEYLPVANHSSGEALRISRASVCEALGNRIATDDYRKRLVKASFRASRLYKENGVEVTAGVAPEAMFLAGLHIPAKKDATESAR